MSVLRMPNLGLQVKAKPRGNCSVSGLVLRTWIRLSCLIYNPDAKDARIKLKVKVNLASVSLPTLEYFSQSEFFKGEDVTKETDGYFSRSE